jgi:HNH endonuclease
MSQTYIPAEMRRLVIARAGRRCEDCLIHEDDTYFGCEVDHVVSEKHGGPTVVENLAYACLACNRNKGSDLGSILVPSGDLIRFFNPRIDAWRDHFSPEGAIIKPLTAIGQVTERIFRFNAIERLMEREALRAIGRYPVGAEPGGT